MRDHGREDRGDGGGARIVASVRLPDSDSPSSADDLVFDLSDLDEMTVQDLSVLLTAQRLASEEDRTVWATGVASATWHALHAMGLTDYFKPFPGEAGERA